MERMLVVIFDNEKKAYEGASALRELEREGGLAVYAGAVVVKNADGTSTPKQVDDLNPVATLVGSSVGALVGLLGGPVGVAIGAASGLTLGALADFSDARVGDDFVEEVLMWGGYAVADGVVALVTGVRQRGRGNPLWPWLLAGILGIVTGVLTFLVPGITALALLMVIATWAIIVGVLQI